MLKLLIRKLPTTDDRATDYGDSDFVGNVELYDPLELAHDSGDIVEEQLVDKQPEFGPEGLKLAELRSYESHLPNSASFDPNGAMLAVLWTDSSGGVQLETPNDAYYML